jgi:hypothetical protein
LGILSARYLERGTETHRYRVEDPLYVYDLGRSRRRGISVYQFDPFEREANHPDIRIEVGLHLPGTQEWLDRSTGLFFFGKMLDWCDAKLVVAEVKSSEVNRERNWLRILIRDSFARTDGIMHQLHVRITHFSLL